MKLKKMAHFRLEILLVTNILFQTNFTIQA